MVTRQSDEELFKAEIEIEELAMQIADMLGAALYYAGVKKSKIPQAADYYLQGIDEVFGDDEDGEMGFEEIIQVIEHMKRTKSNLFE